MHTMIVFIILKFFCFIFFFFQAEDGIRDGRVTGVQTCALPILVIGTAAGLHNAATVVLSIALAFVFGYGLTMRGVLRAGVGLRSALRVALAADTVSIAVMELLDNAFMLVVPGAMDAGLTSALFWTSLAASLVVAFLLTTPLNRWMISRGKGHAVMHQYHHAH